MEGHSDRPVRVLQNGPGRLASARIPEPYGLVIARRREFPAIRAKSHGIHLIILTHDPAFRPARGEVPEPRRLVLAGGGDRLTVRTEYGRSHPTIMSEYIFCFDVPRVPCCQVGERRAT